MALRRARPEDVNAMLDIKRALGFASQDGVSVRGGFLLGTDRDGYLERVAHGLSWVLDDGGVQGFSIVLPDRVFRGSEIWARRDQVQWSVDPSCFDSGEIGYFDQLAVRAGSSRLRSEALALALAPVVELMEAGAQYMMSTTVTQPVQNLAAVPYLRRLGAKRVGVIDEHYPDFGDLVSDVWAVDRRGYLARRDAAPGLAEPKAWLIARAAVGT